jgi:hypothetical protein
VRDPSGPHTAPPPSYSNNAYPLYVPPPQAPDDRAPQAKRRRWLVIGIAAAIVVGIVIAIASTGGSGVEDAAHARPADAGVAVIAAVAVPVAKPAAVPVDATAVAIVSDAAPALAPDAAAVAVAVHVDKPSPVDAFAKAMDDGDYSEAVALCVKTGSLVRNSCTLAACRAHDQAHARRWFVAAGSKPSLAATCKAAGTTVEIEKPVVKDKDKDKEAAKKDCEADPMACQH